MVYITWVFGSQLTEKCCVLGACRLCLGLRWYKCTMQSFYEETWHLSWADKGNSLKNNTVYHGIPRWSASVFSFTKTLTKYLSNMLYNSANAEKQASARRRKMVYLTFTLVSPPEWSKLIKWYDELAFWLQPICAKSTPRSKFICELASRNNCAVMKKDENFELPPWFANNPQKKIKWFH